MIFLGENFLRPRKAKKGFGFLFVSMKKEKLLKREDAIYSQFFMFVISLFHFYIWSQKGQNDVVVNRARFCYVPFQGKNIHQFIESENLSSFFSDAIWGWIKCIHRVLSEAKDRLYGKTDVVSIMHCNQAMSQ